MRRRACVWLSFRTSLERIAPESLTPVLYAFVHGDIWQVLPAQLQDGVARCQFKCYFSPSNINAKVDPPAAKESRRKGVTASSNHWTRPAPRSAQRRIRALQVLPDPSASHPGRRKAR